MTPIETRICTTTTVKLHGSRNWCDAVRMDWTNNEDIDMVIDEDVELADTVLFRPSVQSRVTTAQNEQFMVVAHVDDNLALNKQRRLK